LALYSRSRARNLSPRNMRSIIQQALTRSEKPGFFGSDASVLKILGAWQHSPVNPPYASCDWRFSIKITPHIKSISIRIIPISLLDICVNSRQSLVRGG
ncbi:hypothetical protein QUB75_16525, partial [Microcoleus sp. K1-B6]|uniref:hypothetical protein n=1 Tax=unclassified Microcoleus TaxID=2642155 RepID=UPI002FD165D3